MRKPALLLLCGQIAAGFAPLVRPRPPTTCAASILGELGTHLLAFDFSSTHVLAFDFDSLKDSVLDARDSVLDAKDSVLDAKEAAADSCLLYTSPSPRDVEESRMPSSA